MGAPTSEVGYTSAKTRRGDHEVCMDMWWHWGVGGTIRIVNPVLEFEGGTKKTHYEDGVMK
jgi:hypothetical protein